MRFRVGLGRNSIEKCAPCPVGALAYNDSSRMSSFVERNFRRNYILGLINGALFGFVDAMIAPSLTLALFVAQLGGSNLLIGLLPAIYNGGWFLPQFLIAHRLQSLPLKKPVYVGAAIVRIICWGLLVPATFWLGTSHPRLLLAIFFVLLTIYSFAAGFAGNAFMTMVAKVIPMARRGSFFGWREFLGTAMGLLAGYLIAAVLSTERSGSHAPHAAMPFPNNFALLFLITFAAITLGLMTFAQVREPRETVEREEISFRELLRMARHVVRGNDRFRRYLMTRVVLAAGDLATPFYAIYATRELGAPESIAGLYVALTTLVALLCTPLFSWLSDHRRLNWVFLSGAAATPVMPLLALLFSIFGEAPTSAIAFGLVFVVYGLGRTGANIAFPTYLLNIAPPASRTLYIGLTNTLLGIATFIPIVGGLLLDWFGFVPLFVITCATACIGLWLAWGLARAPVASRS